MVIRGKHPYSWYLTVASLLQVGMDDSSNNIYYQLKTVKDVIYFKKIILKPGK